MLYITSDISPDVKEPVQWDMGWEMASQLLSDINLVSKRTAPFKIENEDYQIYWAGSVLRIDIKKSAVT